MKILVTGVAGFIGYHAALSLINKGHDVVGLDSINDYYDVDLKYSRLKELGIKKNLSENFKQHVVSDIFKKFKFFRCNINDKVYLPVLFKEEKFDAVLNLAAQAGVRYSIENPSAYIDNNINGFFNILECCREFKIKHLVYASSSSVYGLNSSIPFKVSDPTDQPASLYAATKKSNELMAHTYSHLFNIQTTGLRFFTVYGPWGRPDMAPSLFTDAILKNEPIRVFNHGKLERDFTFVDDIVVGVTKVLENNLKRKTLHKVYNIGNNDSVKLLDFINCIEQNLGKVAEKIWLPMQAGDVEKTWANVDDLIKDYQYSPKTTIDSGIKEFVRWYKGYY